MNTSPLICTAAVVLLGMAASAFAGEGCCPEQSAKPANMKGQALGPRPQSGMEPGAMILQHFEKVQPPLSDAQKEQIKKLAEQTRAKIMAAKTPEERRAIHMDMRKTIVNTILTEEQRASLPYHGKGPRARWRKAPMPPLPPPPPAEGMQPPPPPPPPVE